MVAKVPRAITDMSTLSRVIFDPDTISPSIPTGIVATAISSSRIDLAWVPSTDTGGSGLAGYIVYRNGLQVGIASATAFSDTGLSASTTYQYQVASFDGAGNVSALSTIQTATTQSNAGVPAFAPTQPAAGFVGISDTTGYTDPTQQAAIGRYNWFSLGATWESWANSGRDLDVIVKAIKAASTAHGGGTVLFNYQNLNAAEEDANDRYPTYTAEIAARNWRLYVTGSSGTIVGATSTICYVNYTDFVPVNPSLEHPYDFGAKYSYYKFLTKPKSDARFSGLNPGLASSSLDGIFQDNFFLDPRVNGDWNRDNVTEGQGLPCAVTPWLVAGQVRYVTTMRSLAPTKYIFVNAGDYGSSSAGAMVGQPDGLLCESYMGKNWSIETNQTYINLLQCYYRALSTAVNPHLVIFGGNWPDTTTQGGVATIPPINTQWQWARYIAATAYLGEGMPAIGRYSQGYNSDLASLDWYDFYGGVNGLPRGWLGNPVDALRPTTPKLAKGSVGIFGVEYQNGIVLVNPKGNGTQTVNSTDIPGNWKFLPGTQDTTRDTGAVFASVSLPERDGLFLLRYVPSSTPLILYTDITDGPITGGENNKGCYLSIYGVNFGVFSDWGVKNHLYIGGVEVDNYRSLKLAVTNSNASEGPGVFGIQCLRVQVGALGGPTLGTALPITMTINGGSASNSSNSGFLLDLDGNRITFTPITGSILFVSLTGTDQAGFGSAPTGTQGTFANPLRHVQTWNGTNFGGAAWATISGPTTTNRISPGTHIVMMAGEYGSDQSFNTSFCDFFRITGLAASSASQSGSIVITSYPGAQGANSPAIVTINTLAGSAGGFNFADTTRSSETTPWGTTGYCNFITISNLLIHGPTSTFSTSGAAGCPVNWQTQAQGSRVVNCDLSFAPTSGGPTSGGMGGFATNGRRLGNYVHDITDPSGSLQNHGFYIGENTASSNAAAVGELHSVSAYNYMIRCRGGQGIMMRGAYQTESLPYCSIHHNWIQGPGKFGIELFDQRDRGNIYCNVIIGEAFTATATTGTQAGIVIGSDNVTAANGIYIGYNTVVGNFNHYATLYCLGGPNSSGSALLEGNIFRQAVGTGSPPFGSWLLLNTGGLKCTLNGNVWFDASGNSANPSDATGIFADPLLTSVVSPYDLHPASNSTLPNKGPVESIANQARDFLFQLRPQGSNTKWSMGAIERTGG